MEFACLENSRQDSASNRSLVAVAPSVPVVLPVANASRSQFSCFKVKRALRVVMLLVELDGGCGVGWFWLCIDSQASFSLHPRGGIGYLLF